MNVLVTGSNGFVGKNLCQWISQRRSDVTILTYDIGSSDNLASLCHKADFVFHLAGVNRPQNDDDYEIGNRTLTEEVLEYCQQGKKPPILLTSSAQAVLDNPYGKSKLAAENAVFTYASQTGSLVYVYRLPGVFGKWCRPNYNSVVATFCSNIANNLPIEIRDPDFELSLVYIDDVCRCFVEKLDTPPVQEKSFCSIQPIYNITLGQLGKILNAFNQSRTSLQILDMSDPLIKNLHTTYLSYLQNFSYPLKTHADERGCFAEFLKSNNGGQVSVNVTKPGYTKGNHWHHTKVEKFLTVSGQGIIRFRKIDEANIIEYSVSGDKLEVVDIPPGYTHSISNIGETDLVTIMWVNEIYDPSNPDTFVENIFPKEG